MVNVGPYWVALVNIDEEWRDMTEQSTTLPPDQTERQSDEELWEVSDVMAFLKVSDTTVRRRVAEGMPALRIGAVLRFVPDEVRAWAREQAA